MNMSSDAAREAHKRRDVSESKFAVSSMRVNWSRAAALAAPTLRLTQGPRTIFTTVLPATTYNSPAASTPNDLGEAMVIPQSLKLATGALS